MDALPDLDVRLGHPAVIDAAAWFRDPDGDALTFAARSLDAGVARATVAGDRVTVEGVAPGSATVEVTARDGGGLSAAQRFEATVGAGVALALGVAQAREGGIARIEVVLDEAATSPLTVRYALGVDDARLTDDADSADVLGAGEGEVEVPAGAAGAVIEIGIADDDEIEPPREVFTLALGRPATGSGQQTPVDVFGRAHVEPAGRLRRQQQLRAETELARKHELLLVSARQGGSRGVGPRRPDREALDGPLGRLAHGPDAEPEGRAERRAVARLEGQVFPQSEGHQKTGPVTVLGDMPDIPKTLAARGGEFGQVEAAPFDGAHPGDRLGQLLLAVAVDAGDPKDFALEQREPDAVDRAQAAVVADAQVVDPQDRGARPVAAPARRDDVVAHHEPGELGRIGLGGGHRAGEPAAAQHC